jgi:hypothetical protein
MNLFLEIIFLLVLGILFYQDLKERKVSLWVLITGIILGATIHYSYQQKIVFVSNICINLIFIALIFGTLWLYAMLKLKKRIFEVFGQGDLLFFILMAVSLPIVSFLVVFVFSLLFSLIIFMITKERFKTKNVPLAGLQSLFLGLVLLANKCLTSIDIYAL